MKKLSMAFLVVLVTGCSSMEMGMRTSGSGSDDMEASSGDSLLPYDLKRMGSGGTVIDPRTGDLSPYHGG